MRRALQAALLAGALLACSISQAAAALVGLNGLSCCNAQMPCVCLADIARGVLSSHAYEDCTRLSQASDEPGWKM